MEMEIPVLKVEQRQERGKGPARRMRDKGLIPAVCYGRGKESLALAVNPDELFNILRGERGLNSLIRLDGAENRTVFVQEMQRHPVDRDVLHVDFLWVDTGKKVQRTVPIELVGLPVGVKLGGGLLQVARRRLLVEALPDRLPESVKISVAEMEIGDVIHVAEIEMPEGVNALFDRNFTVCAVIAPAVEEEKEEAKAAEEEAGAVAGAEAKPEGEAAPAAEEKEKEKEKEKGKKKGKKEEGRRK